MQRLTCGRLKFLHTEILVFVRYAALFFCCFITINKTFLTLLNFIRNIRKIIVTTATQFLRDSTRYRHAALERVPLAHDLMSSQLDLPRYVEILRAWSSAWAVLERCIWESPLAFEVSALLPSRRAHLAQDDLLFWQQQRDCEVPAATASPGLINTLRPTQVAGLLGICYVARGASLGNKVISGHLKKVLPVSRGQGISFFAHESDESLTWPQWSHSLDTQLAEPEALAQAVIWADATFAALLEAFTGAPSNLSANA